MPHVKTFSITSVLL